MSLEILTFWNMFCCSPTATLHSYKTPIVLLPGFFVLAPARWGSARASWAVLPTAQISLGLDVTGQNAFWNGWTTSKPIEPSLVSLQRTGRGIRLRAKLPMSTNATSQLVVSLVLSWCSRLQNQRSSRLTLEPRKTPGGWSSLWTWCAQRDSWGRWTTATGIWWIATIPKFHPCTIC